MGFLELRRQCGFSYEVRRGAQGASRVPPGKSGFHVGGEGKRVIALESWRGLGPQDALKKDSRGLSRVSAGNPGFPLLASVNSGSSSECL